jgi:hypothetical protein
MWNKFSTRHPTPSTTIIGTSGDGMRRKGNCRLKGGMKRRSPCLRMYQHAIDWLYGYFVPGNPSLIDWHAHTPWWIADFLPNIESEIGMVLMLLSMAPTYSPRSRVSL